MASCADANVKSKGFCIARIPAKPLCLIRSGCTTGAMPDPANAPMQSFLVTRGIPHGLDLLLLKAVECSCAACALAPDGPISRSFAVSQCLLRISPIASKASLTCCHSKIWNTYLAAPRKAAAGAGAGIVLGVSHVLVAAIALPVITVAARRQCSLTSTSSSLLAYS
jgi:hypothetical protein